MEAVLHTARGGFDSHSFYEACYDTPVRRRSPMVGGASFRVRSVQVRILSSARMKARPARTVVVHLFRRTTECLRCGLRPAPHLVIVFTENVETYLSLPTGHVQCVLPA